MTPRLVERTINEVVYVSEDGHVFDTFAACKEYDDDLNNDNCPERKLRYRINMEKTTHELREVDKRRLIKVADKEVTDRKVCHVVLRKGMGVYCPACGRILLTDKKVKFCYECGSRYIYVKEV